MQQEQRESIVTLPGNTKAVMTMRVSPRAISRLQPRQRARPVGAIPIL